MAKQCEFLEKALARLEQDKGRLRQVAADAGVPYSTLSKLTARSVTNPRVETVQALHDYYAERDRAELCAMPDIARH
ncbi:helix-turn-helix domain-containing protein [Burkholderia gladioli]|uniref:helix-turn-helix domain-containing protein n=1 Tax=Burkholderia gladioli TaxID=28095 RepID=UPI000F0B31A6|nr:helix-turn-helix domain-containing protein [Burkholderia gladioli]